MKSRLKKLKFILYPVFSLNTPKHDIYLSHSLNQVINWKIINSTIWCNFFKFITEKCFDTAPKQIRPNISGNEDVFILNTLPTVRTLQSLVAINLAKEEMKFYQFLCYFKGWSLIASHHLALFATQRSPANDNLSQHWQVWWL